MNDTTITKQELDKYDYISMVETVSEDNNKTVVVPICFINTELLNGDVTFRYVDLDNEETNEDVDVSKSQYLGIAMCINDRIGVYLPALRMPNEIRIHAIEKVLEIRFV